VDEFLMTPQEFLELATQTQEEKEKQYGKNYEVHAEIMAKLFPNGISLVTIEDHIRFGVFTQIVGKLTRYGHNFKGGGHQDSALDSAVYWSILDSVDKGTKG
jgi:hypothetical protein